MRTLRIWTMGLLLYVFTVVSLETGVSFAVGLVYFGVYIILHGRPHSDVVVPQWFAYVIEVVALITAIPLAAGMALGFNDKIEAAKTKKSEKLTCGSFRQHIATRPGPKPAN